MRRPKSRGGLKKVPELKISYQNLQILKEKLP